MLGWVAAGLGVLIASAVGFLFVLAPADIVRDRVIAEVKAKTGRDLSVAGTTSLSFFPALAVTLTDVSLSGPPGMQAPATVVIERFDARLPLGSLLQRRVEVAALVLTRPVFHLTVDAQGRRSWDFAHALPLAGPVQVAQAGPGLPPGLSPAAQSSGAGDDISLGDVRIVQGTVIYQDLRSGFADTLSGIDVAVSSPSRNSSAEVVGAVTARGEKVELSAKIATLDAILRGRPVQVSAMFSAPRVKGTYAGTLSPGGGSDGRVSVSGASAKRAAAWAGLSLPGVAGLGPFDVAGGLTTDDRTIRFSDAVITLDGQRATGRVAVMPNTGARPRVTAELTASALDLNLYTPDGSPAITASSPVRPPARGAAPTSIEDLLRGSEGATQVRGYARRAGWSEEPMGTDSLGAADLDIRLSTSALTWRQIKLGPTRLAVGLKEKVLRADLEDVRLYDGRGRGLVILDAAGPTRALTLQLALEDVRALPLMSDAAGFDWMDGRARVSVAVAGQGVSEKAIVESLQGRIETTLKDGALIGLNVAQMLRGLGQGKLPGAQRIASEKTDFSDMAATYRVQNGVAQSSDFRLASPLLRVTGTGQFHLPARTLDWTMRPRIVGSLQGQGGAADLTGLEVPIRVAGAWDDPKIAVDVDGLLKDPGKAVDAARQIGKQLGLGKALEGLLGSEGQSSSGDGGQPPQNGKVDLKGLLNQFLKK